MTVLGAIFIMWTTITVVRGSLNWVPWLLAGAVPFMTASAVIVGDNKVSPFYVAAFAPLFFVVCGRGQDSKRGKDVYGLLLVMAVYMTITAVALPKFFAGTPVLIPRGGIDDQVNAPGDLMFSVSNVAQAGYLLLSITVVLFFMRNRPSRPHFLAFGFGLGTVLNSWALGNQLTGLPFPQSLFDDAVGERFTSSFGGEQRLRGVYSEPSYLAVFALAAAIYFLFLQTQLRGGSRFAALTMLAGNFAILVYSYSGTAVASAIAMFSLLAVVYAARSSLGAKMNVGVVVLAHLGAAAFIVTSGPLIGYVSSIVNEKIGGDSFNNRNSSNSFSWDLLLHTYGLGSGLGSNRPSSFLLMLLSTVGVIGTLLFVLIVAKVTLSAARERTLMPEVWALTATLVAKIISEPNLSQPAMWLALGACAVVYAPYRIERPAEARGAISPVDRLSRQVQPSKTPERFKLIS